MACCEKEILLKKIDNISFMCDDIRLFLDTHPKNQQALYFYDKYTEVRKKLVREYHEKFGGLTWYDYSGGKWNWCDEPWPWQWEV